MQREGDRREITGVTWKNKLRLSIGTELPPNLNGHVGAGCFTNLNTNGEPALMATRNATRIFPGMVTGMVTRMTVCTLDWKRKPTHVLAALAAIVLLACTLFAQDSTPPAPAPQSEPPSGPVYQPKYHSDPARSDSEFAALAYMRVVMRAQVGFNKQYGHYATALTQLIHSGTFTQRMVNPDRGDYTVGFKSKKDNFVLTMTPKSLDPQHRSFYAENDGKIHAEETKPADPDSPVVETHHW